MRKLARTFAAAACVIFATACATIMIDAKPTITKGEFGKTADGKPVEIYTLKNSAGAEMRVITYGGAVVSLTMPDKKGKFDDVVLGFDSVAAYEKQDAFIGALIGRYGNRIGGAKFTLGGETFTLGKNNGDNNLHGGFKGFDKVVWTAARNFVDADGASLELTLRSPDGDQGFPGNLSVTVVYTLTEKNEMKVVYSATTDRDTLCNLTQHSYFNLAGASRTTTILDHFLTLNADKFTPTDAGAIPTGELRSVKGTPMDFLKPRKMGERIDADYEQNKFGKGYDHNWILNKKGRELSLAATVFEKGSGRVMEVLTTEPGLQFYSGNFLNGSVPGKSGKTYPFRTGFCLEAQGWPDSPNKPNFPSTVLKKGETYSQTTIYRFSTKK